MPRPARAKSNPDAEMTIAQGDRVYLRAPTAKDAKELLALLRASRKFLRPWVTPMSTHAEFEAYLTRMEDDRHVGALVCLRDNHAIAGVINVNEIVGGFFQSGYLGYYAGARYAGRGLMRDGVSAMVSFAFRRLRLHRLEANIQPENTASLRLVASLGFHREGLSPRYLKIAGRWRDHERWAVLSEGWPPNKALRSKASRSR